MVPTDNIKKILNLFVEKLKGNDEDMLQENNGLISRIEEVTVDIAICELKEGIDCSNIHSNHLKKTGTVFKEFLCKMLNYFLRHDYIYLIKCCMPN